MVVGEVVLRARGLSLGFYPCQLSRRDVVYIGNEKPWTILYPGITVNLLWGALNLIICVLLGRILFKYLCFGHFFCFISKAIKSRFSINKYL